MKKFVLFYFFINIFLFANFNLKVFYDKIDYLQKIPLQDRDNYAYKIIAEYKKITNFPLIDGENVVFVYWGMEKNVYISGDFTKKNKKIKMQNIKGTSLFYKIMTFEKDSRIEYNYILDNGKIVIDQLNKKYIDSNGIKKSLLIMPEYNSYKNIIDTEEYLEGKLSELIIERRKIFVYLPYNYNENTSYKFFYILDGKKYMNETKIVQLLNKSIYLNVIKPSIFVFISDVDSEKDFLFSDNFNDFVVKRVVPEVESRFAKNVIERVIIGEGLSSIQGIYLMAKSSLFNRIISQSGFMGLCNNKKVYYKDSVINRKKSLREELIKSNNNRGIYFYLIVGYYENNATEKYNNYKENVKFYDYLLDNKMNLSEIKFKIYNQNSGITLIEDSIIEALTWCN